MPGQSSDPINGSDVHRTRLLAWMTIGSPYIVELSAQAGFDAVVVDCQHGLAGKAELINCLTAARAAAFPALVRVSSLNEGDISGALDAGARGVVCPMINTRAEAEKFVAAVKYPPVGARSYGPYRGKLVKNGDYFSSANSWTIACAQIETAEAVANLEEILNVLGLDMVLVGPNDLAISLSGGKSRDINAQPVIDAIDTILEKSREQGINAAIFANDTAYARPLMNKGWKFVAIGTDAGLLSEAFRQIVSITYED